MFNSNVLCWDKLEYKYICCMLKCLSAFRFDILVLQWDHMKATSPTWRKLPSKHWTFSKCFIFDFQSPNWAIPVTGASDVLKKAVITLWFSCLEIQLPRCCRSLTLTSQGPQAKLKQWVHLKVIEQQTDHSSRTVQGPSPWNCSVTASEIKNEAVEKSICLLGN